MYLPWPRDRTANQGSYSEAYRNIVETHRRHPAASVVILVSPDVDALCAARMLADLLTADDVVHRTIPVAGIDHLERLRDEMFTYTDLYTLILLNIGAILELPSPSWFGDFPPRTSVHIIDSSRPHNLSSIFGAGENGDRIIVWDDGDAEKLQEERKAWEAMMYEPEPDSDEDDESDLDDSSDPEDDGQEDDEEEEYEQGQGGKRRSIGDGSRKGKRRRIEGRMSREERNVHSGRLEKYYMSGTWHGMSAAGILYTLAAKLQRADNDFLWLAITALTFQYTTSRISRDDYDRYHDALDDELRRLNPPLSPSTTNVITTSADDTSIRPTSELRLILFRHWNLYDAMFHSAYIASKVGIWKERGRKRLTGLLAKIGFSLSQTQQPYAHMDMDLKASLQDKLVEATMEEYTMTELTYPSFIRSFGYRSQPLSAADAVEGIGALLDVGSGGGLKIEVEIEGARNGGEWFGGGRVWENSSRKRKGDEENVPPAGVQTAAKPKPSGDDDAVKPQNNNGDVDWWIKNFWLAYDSLRSISSLQRSLTLSMSLHRAIIRQGTAIIDHQDIRTMRSHRVVVLTQGPDLALFSHPGILSRLALWLVDALRERLPGTNVSTRSKRKSLPFVVCCLDESSSSYVVVGVMASTEFGDIRKNEFGLAFLDAKERCNARVRHGSFDTSVLEINQDDLHVFLETLCEGPEAY